MITMDKTVFLENGNNKDPFGNFKSMRDKLVYCILYNQTGNLYLLLIVGKVMLSLPFWML